jgi:trans-aconitate 2-methyltransferase
LKGKTTKGKRKMPWNPDRYNQFKAERSAPFEDLLQLIKIRPGLKVIDLGCGTGELTSRLASKLPGSRVLGIDSSPDMLTKTQAFKGSNLDFQLREIQEIEGDWDLIFSNAAIQWIDDHHTLVPRLFSHLGPGGQLVIQLPSNHNHPAHRMIIETASEQPFERALNGWLRHVPVLSVEEYAELLFAAGGQDLIVFEKVYPHVLADADAVADWSSGTALLPYMERLDPQLREPFMQRYRQKLRQQWPNSPVFYGFRRILFAARRG